MNEIVALISILLLSFSPNDDKGMDDLMEMDLGEILNMEISSATKTKMKSEDAPGIVSVITREEIRAYGMETLDDALSMIPGFTVGRSLQNRDFIPPIMSVALIPFFRRRC